MFIWIFFYEEQNINAQILINKGHTNRGGLPVPTW